MANLLLRDIPQDLLEKLKTRAQRDHRSVPAETVHMLLEQLERDEREARHREAIESLTARMKNKAPIASDSLTMLREDRAR